MWVIMNKRREKVGFIDIENEDNKSLTLLSDTLERQLEDGYDTLTFSVPTNHEKTSLLEKEGFIVYTADKRVFRLFRIKKIFSSSVMELTTRVSCETAATSDLLGDYVRPIKFNTVMVGDVVDTLLSPTGWRVGICESENMIEIEFNDYPSVLEAVREVAAKDKLEIEFTAELDAFNNIMYLNVNLYKKRGRETGEIIEYGKNLEGLTKEEDTNKIITAIICVGGEDANGNPISIVNAAVTPPAPFEKVDDYIGDTDALAEWGNEGKHIFGKYVNTEAQNPVDLYNLGLEELKKNNKPIVTYTVEAKYFGIEADIGDTIVVKDTERIPKEYINARVLKLSTSITKPDDDSFELGEFVPIVVTPIAAIKKLQDTIKLKEAAWDKAKEDAKEAKEDAKEANNKITVKVSGVEQFNNGVGANVYLARAFQKGQEIDVDGTTLYYLWNMYDNTNAKIEGYERSGKTLTLQATEFNKRVRLECVAFELPEVITEV